MERRHLLKTFAGLALCPLCLVAGAVGVAFCCLSSLAAAQGWDGKTLMCYFDLTGQRARGADSWNPADVGKLIRFGGGYGYIVGNRTCPKSVRVPETPLDDRKFVVLKPEDVTW